MIYFDNAATSLQKPSPVPEAVAYAITHFGGVGRGTHEAAILASQAVYRARGQVARLFGAPSARCVSFTSNATEALNIAIEGLLQPGDHAITSAASHNSVLRPLYRKQQNGCTLSIAPIGADGSLDYDAFASLFTPAARLVVMTHSSNLTGDVYDIAHIATICREHDALLLVDVAQTAGLIPIDMGADGIDVFAFTGHKSLYGPQGTGGLCVREGLEIPPLLSGGSGTHTFDKQHPTFMPEALEAGTLNSHGIAGLSAGLDYLEDQGIDDLHRRTLAVADRFVEGVRALGNVQLYGAQEGTDRSGIVALNIDGYDSAQVSDYLSTEHNIATRSGAHCAPLMHEALGTTDRGIVRFSFSSFNTFDEVDRALEALKSLIRKDRS